MGVQLHLEPLLMRGASMMLWCSTAVFYPWGLSDALGLCARICDMTLQVPHSSLTVPAGTSAMAQLTLVRV